MQEIKNKIPFDEWYKKQMKNDLVNFLDLKYRGSESSRINTPKFFMPLIKKLNYKSFYFLQTMTSHFLNFFGSNEKEKLENAKKLLDLCWFIRILDNDEDKDFNFLINAMGLKDFKWEKKTGLTKNTFKITPKIRQMIYKDNALDYELYNYALELRKKKIDRIKKELIHNP